jgi:addiction module HigA family antidote
MKSKSQTTTAKKMRNESNTLLGIHPGEILREEFLKPLHLTAYRLAKETLISPMRVSEILRGKRALSADTALRLARYFGNSPVFWTNLQSQHDLEIRQIEIAAELQKIRPLPRDAARA